MAKYTTRVELHHANYIDYETLHTAMAAEGFSRTISDGKKTYRLPEAEYNCDSDAEKDVVLAAAERAASKTRKRYAILVTKSDGRTWTGLDEV